MSTDETQTWQYTPNPNDSEGEEPKYLGLLTWFTADGQEVQSEIDFDLAKVIIADHIAVADLTHEVERYRTLHECKCDSEVGHLEYCVNNLFDRMESDQAKVADLLAALRALADDLYHRPVTDADWDSGNTPTKRLRAIIANAEQQDQ